MKIFAQCGYGEGQKINKGLAEELIDGVIYSPKDITSQKLREKLTELSETYPEAELLFDPQYYVSMMGKNPNLNVGKLESYTDDFFSLVSRNKLESEKNVTSDIKKVIEFQNTLPLSSKISPNILISKTFDSIEGVISKHFIRLAKEAADEVGNKGKLICTLAISTEAISNLAELQEFLSSITIIDNPPDGFYLLIGARSLAIANSELFNADVIAGWMLLNYSLNVNGFRVINGYSDLLSPFLTAAGGEGISTGWFSNLRNFSLERFAPLKQDGGSLPIIRYLSTSLLNRIRFDELNALKDRFKQILNNLGTDQFYAEEEIDRTNEILQNWDALYNISLAVSKGSTKSRIELCNNLVDNAIELYSQISPFFPLDPKSSGNHLEAIQLGLEKFSKLAEI